MSEFKVITLCVMSDVFEDFARSVNLMKIYSARTIMKPFSCNLLFLSLKFSKRTENKVLNMIFKLQNTPTIMKTERL